MRKIDRKNSFRIANILAEQNYLKNKGLLEENMGMEYGYTEESIEEPFQQEMEMEETPTPMTLPPQAPQMDVKNTLRQMEPKDAEGKENFLRELESFVQELRYVIKRGQEGI